MWTNSTPPFSVTSTLPAAQALLRSITYRNTGAAAPATSRTVQFQVTDGAGGTSNAARKGVNGDPVGGLALPAPFPAGLHYRQLLPGVWVAGRP